VASGRRAALAAVLVAIAAGATWCHESSTYRSFGRLVRSGHTRDSVVALTFDDGPTEFTDSVLAILASRGVRATFYLVGEQAALAPELTRRIVAAGHELGNHSYSHHRMESLLPGSIPGEIERTDSLIRAAGFDRPITFRSPYGRRKFGLLWYLARHERPLILWTIDPDTRQDTAEGIVEEALRRIRPGAIVLLHVESPRRAASRAALPILIDSLATRGYRFATISQLLGPEP
jgi:peptidoglycan/xylan/chitin deacetylase (PgdA/CDA1 family)